MNEEEFACRYYMSFSAKFDSGIDNYWITLTDSYWVIECFEDIYERQNLLHSSLWLLLLGFVLRCFLLFIGYDLDEVKVFARLVVFRWF